MGIFESLEDDKKISDEYMEYVKNNQSMTNWVKTKKGL
jgi:hypothetical protein